ncbi:MAG: asparagine synthase (glutamine-hydrolyzing) [Alphaproteobacteria bacterium]|nr:asparagine synthase (glutamine-hydrolyzing) [Alphaproteobacteria bacterium]
MCGIVSALSWRSPINGILLKSGTDALIHRGPDGEGFWISPRRTAGLGHRRLSIIDLSTGTQPISSEDGKKVVVVNGEFYGHKAIRRELESKGHQFKTHSDSEIVLHLYEEHGTDCLKHLRGEFAFVLWDEEKQLLFAARDRFGIKPLCYTSNEDGLFIASEAKALFAMGIKAAWDEYAFFHSARMQYTPQDRTLFKDIYQLKPGHALIARNKDMQIFKYWDMDYPAEEKTVAFTSEADCIAQFGELFEEAVSLRLQADVPVCFHLSGGLDSAAILGVAAKLMDTPAHAFTVSFEHDAYDELPLAEEMARHANAVLHPVKVTQDDIIYQMQDAVWYGEGMAVNGHLTSKYLLNKAIRAAGFKVALTGEGADEVLAGYPHFRQDLLRMSPENDAGFSERLLATNRVSAGVQLAYGDMLPTAAVRKRLGFVPGFLEAKAAMGFRMDAILSDEFKSGFPANDCYSDLMQETPVAAQLSGRHPVNQSSWLWGKTALANYILRTLGDGMEMSASIEGRLPFLDHHLFEFVHTLPMTFKIRNGIEKYILREAAKPYITETIYKRQKHPFMAPPVSNFSNKKLMSFIRDNVQSSSFSALPFYDRKKVTAMLDRLPTLPEQERVAMEPVLMMMLTSHLLQQRFGLRA